MTSQAPPGEARVEQAANAWMQAAAQRDAESRDRPWVQRWTFATRP